MYRAGIRRAVVATSFAVAMAAGCQLVLDFAPLPDGGSGRDAAPADANALLCAESEPNDSLDAAATAPAAAILAAICPAGDRDFYQFSVDGSQDVSILVTFTEGVGDLELSLHDSTTAEVLTISTGTDGDEEIVQRESLGNRLPAGTYAAEVFGRTGSEVTEYRLEVVVSASQADAGAL